MKTLSLLFLMLGLALPVFAQTDKILVNLDKHGLALQGYDPVAFFTDQKPVKGKADLQSTYHGGTYWFASAEHKALFDANPRKIRTGLRRLLRLWRVERTSCTDRCKCVSNCQ